MRTIIALAAIAAIAACSPSTGPGYLNRDGNATSWGEGKREINTSLADVITKDDH